MSLALLATALLASGATVGVGRALRSRAERKRKAADVVIPAGYQAVLVGDILACRNRTCPPPRKGKGKGGCGGKGWVFEGDERKLCRRDGCGYHRFHARYGHVVVEDKNGNEYWPGLEAAKVAPKAAAGATKGTATP